MTLYSIYADTKNFRKIEFDRDQMFEDYGSLPNHFDLNYEPKPFAPKQKREFSIQFKNEGKGLSGDQYPDISEFQGRLYLNQKAYDALAAILSKDGEFLTVQHEHGKGYIFNPLHCAEEKQGLDETLSKKNEWGDIENAAFHEDKVKEFTIFKTAFDAYLSAYCQENLKEAIEENGLQGAYFTPDLGNPHTAELAQKLRND